MTEAELQYEITVQFTDDAKNSFMFEVQSRRIRWAIELACKEMKVHYPSFEEGYDFQIVGIVLKH